MQIPFDAESVKDISELEKVHWPIKSAEYKKLANEMIKLVSDFRDFDASPTFSDIYILKYRYILYSILFVSYSLLSLNRFRKKDQDLIASERSSLFNAIKDDLFPAQSLFIPPKQSRSFKSFVKAIISRHNLMRGNIFSYGPVPLSLQYIKENNLPSKLLYWAPPQFSYERATKIRDTLHLNEFSSELCVQVKQVLNNNEIILPKVPLEYLNKTIKLQLLMGYQDVNRSSGIGKKGDKVLLVGTGGHYPHRLLSYYFERNGNKVIRFDHGGERALFLDSHWGINEFAFLDVFMTFGKGLKKRIEKNIRENNIPFAKDEKNSFEVKSIVSESLQNINKKNAKARGEEVKKVMVLMPGLLGNWLIPGNYPPDFVFLKVIWHTIKELKRNRYYVILKKHPKTLRSKSFSLFDKFVDEIRDDYFAEAMEMADAYIFFYCGTAFCEALMSLKPIVYIHLPYRQVDLQTRSELEKILCWIDCNDTDGLFVDNDKMVNYLKNNNQDMMPRRDFVEENYLTASN